MSFDVANLVAQFGAYYIKGDESNIARVKSKLYMMSETASFFQMRPTTNTQWRSTLAQVTSVVQAFQKAWTPKGIISIEPSKFDLFKLKIDFDAEPDDLEATYLGFLAEMAELDRAKWPAIRWLIEEHLMAAKEEDHEKFMSFTGKYVAPTTSVPGNTIDSMDGIRAVLRGYNTAGRLNLTDGPIEMGAVAADAVDFVDQVEAFAEAMNPELRSKIDYIFMSDQHAMKYRRGKRKKYNMYHEQSKDLLTLEDRSTISVQGLRSHAGSDLMWATPKINRLRPVKKSANLNVFRVESAKRQVSIFTDWWEALNYEVPEFVITNEHDLVP